MSSVRFPVRPLLVALFVPLAVVRCDCADPLAELPKAQIEVLDDTGVSHTTADPWLKVDFGDADSGQTKARPLTVKNIGSAALVVEKVCVVNAVDVETAKTAPCIVGQATAFTFASLAGTELKAGDAAEMLVTFAPTAGGPAQMFLQIGSTAVDEPVVAVELVGRGTDGRLCAEPDATYDFGDVDIGVTAPPGSLTVRNCGVKPVTIATFAFSQNPDTAFTYSAQGGDPVGRTLAENETIVLDLSFTPQQPGPYRDTRAGDITVTTAAPFAARYDLLLVGNGRVPPACQINVVPSTLNFNAVASEQSSTRPIIIQSVGQCGCTVDSITGPEPADAHFTIDPAALPTLPLVLKGTVGCAEDPAGADAAGSSVQIDVTYTSPARQAPEVDNATVTVTTSDLVEPTQIVQLEANGGGEPFCQLDVTPRGGSGFFDAPPGRIGKVEFGRTSVFFPKRLPITLTNIGNTNCNVTSVEYDKEDNTLANEFSLENETGGAAVGGGAFAIAPGDTRTFFAVFSPTHLVDGITIFGKYFGATPPPDANPPTILALCGRPSDPSTRCNGVTFVTDDTVTTDNSDEMLPLDGVFSIGFDGTPVEPDVDVIPGDLDFGVVTLDCGSPEQRVTVYNNGGADLIVGQPVVDPITNPATFEVTGTTAPSYPHTVPPGSSLSINVRYYARVVGLQTGNLIIPTVEGTGEGPPVLIPMRGEGTLDIHQVDVFDQLNAPKVDVLWVIDDSGSMAPFQEELADNFGEFFVESGITAADFHIAVTTTLTSSGGGALGQSAPDDDMSGWYTSCIESEHYLSPASGSEAVVESRFECNVSVSNRDNVHPERSVSDNAEGGLRAALKFLSPPLINDPAANDGFLRDDAKLHVIMVSDEPEQSKGGIQQYIDFFKNVKGFRNEGLVAISAIAPPPQGCDYGGDVLQDDRYKPVVDEMNGRFQEICNSDWSSMMSQLGLDSLGLRVEFFLTRAATAESLGVCVRATAAASCVPVDQTDESDSNGYFYDPSTNSIVFNSNSVPPRGSRIEVSYNAFCFQ